MNKLTDFSSVAEKQEDNLSGEQISDTLNYLLYSALQPIIHNTDFLQRGISQIIYQIDIDHRRKISVLPKEDLTAILFMFLFEKNPSKKLFLIKTAQLERSLLFQLIQSFLEITDNYEYYEIKDLKGDTSVAKHLAYIELSVYGQRKNLSATNKWAKSFLTQYLNFKNTIMEKYYKYVIQEASRISRKSGIEISQEDAEKNLIISLSKAIDKYNPKQGTLTGNIRMWFKNTALSPQHDHTLGQSYSLTGSARRKIASDYSKKGQLSFGFDLADVENDLISDEISPEKKAESNDEIKEITRVISGIKEDVNLAILLYDLPWSPTSVKSYVELSQAS